MESIKLSAKALQLLIEFIDIAQQCESEVNVFPVVNASSTKEIDALMKLNDTPFFELFYDSEYMRKLIEGVVKRNPYRTFVQIYDIEKHDGAVCLVTKKICCGINSISIFKYIEETVSSIIDQLGAKNKMMFSRELMQTVCARCLPLVANIEESVNEIDSHNV